MNNIKKIFAACALILFFIITFTAASNAASLIIDHNNTDITTLTQDQINRAKSALHIAYGHTSHGSQITTGMSGLVNFANSGGKGLSLPYNIFAWNNGGAGGALDLHDYAMEGDVGYYPQWVNNTRSYLDNPANDDVNVIIWSWCGQVDSKYAAGTLESEYLMPMQQLELDYPDVSFVYMTGHVDHWDDANNKAANRMIRDFAIANDKILYDFADIESYDPDGVFYEFPNDNADYYESEYGAYLGNWAVEWQDSHTQGVDWYNCSSAHSQPLNANQKAYAAWHLWCGIEGRMNPETLPIADAGANVAGFVGEIVTVDGSASTDPDDGPQPLEFAWTIVSVPDGSSVTGSDLICADCAQCSFLPDVQGFYVLELTVNDGQNQASDQVRVAAMPPENAGDLNNDSHVNLDDFYILRAHLNQPANVCPECDIDGDGAITFGDARKLFIQCDCPRCGYTCAQTPVATHPRLWIRSKDVTRLRSWATQNNPMYTDSLLVMANRAKQEMDDGEVPDNDLGGNSWTAYPTEGYAMLFAFMSLVSNDAAERYDYAQRAKTLLMHVMNIAVLGVAEDQPYRDILFSTRDRSRWWGEAFPLTVDWIYPYLSKADKQTIRTVFLRWCEENLTGYRHPEPVGATNDPVLIDTPAKVRTAANNYFTAHMRNIGLMAMCMDSDDDPGNTLRNYIDNATGSWLYMSDHFLRNDGRGGLSCEGFEYGPGNFGRVADFLLGLHTAGYDSPSYYTPEQPQTAFFENEFWDQFLEGYFHSLSPKTTIIPGAEYLGQVYEPSFYGDGQDYFNPDHIGVFGDMGIYDIINNNSQRLNSLRWACKYTSNGGAEKLYSRARIFGGYVTVIKYFMLFDPNALEPIDPKSSYGTEFFSEGLNRVLSRTGWSEDATWFTYQLSWNSIDHQHGAGNSFELYRNGEWLIKEWTGYGFTAACSDFHNTICVQNDMPNRYSNHRIAAYDHGSQWLLDANGDPAYHSISWNDNYFYATGDATSLYNSDYLEANDVEHVSRSIFWLKPDMIFIYDRVSSFSENRFKRFWLNFANEPEITGRACHAQTDNHQNIYVQSLQPANANLTIVTSTQNDYGWEETANYEPMHYRLMVEAQGNPVSTSFFHVIQATDNGVSASAANRITEIDTNFDGSTVDGFAVIFQKSIKTALPQSFSYSVSESITNHFITALAAQSGYSISVVNDDTQNIITISAGGETYTDKGGVLHFTTLGGAVLTNN